MEVRPRKKEFDNVLRAEIYDPLWMLGRQWQFGEFQGEDTGSATLVKVALESTTISKFQTGDTPAVPYTDDVPLETTVEADVIHFDYKTRVKTGSQWFKILKSAGLLPVGLKDSFREEYPVALPEIEEGDSANKVVAKARLLSNHSAMQFVDAAGERSMDGTAFYHDLMEDRSEVINRFFSDLTGDASLNAVAAVERYIKWFEKLYYYPMSGENKSWNPQQLEYQFACSLPEEGANTVLRANEYYSGDLDWYSFDIDKGTPANGLGDEDSAQDESYRSRKTLTVIPTAAQFGGMPAKRWWEFEDAAVDLGNISADEKNLAKVLIAEFSLVYGNNWFIVPFDVPVGSLSEVKGIVVTDSFGQKTLVEIAGKGVTGDWSRWNMFSLTTLKGRISTQSETDNRIFFPPVLTKAHESEPVEMVKFIRDEMANMVWGVEDRIPDMLGESMDGHQASYNLTEFLKKMYTLPDEDEEQLAGDLKYQLASTIPENWIPFVPVHLSNDNRAMKLRRASMPRTFKPLYPQSPGQIRPRTYVLRYGLNDDDIQQSPYDIFEEEVPKAGVQVMATFQRARWYDGKIFTWYGRKKRTGRGQGSSGLRFDTTSEIKKR